MEYTNLEIRIRALEGEGYPVEITTDSQPFPIGHLPPAILPWIPGSSPAQDGERLFELLIHDPGLRANWAEARGHSLRRRIRIQIDTDAPELHTIPWEILREMREGGVPQSLAADADTPFSRFLAIPKPARVPIDERPIKMLVALASPVNLAEYGLEPLDIEVERSTIDQAVAAAEPDAIVVTYLPLPVTLDALERELEQGYHILHIVAHGAVSKNGDRTLFLADASNHVAHVSDTTFAEMIERKDTTLRLVFFASCQSAKRSSADAFRGFAPQVVAAGVPAAIAMQEAMPVSAARVFTATFYRLLLTYGYVDRAGNGARSMLLSTGKADSWGIPVVFSCVPDSRIITIVPKEETPPWWMRYWEQLTQSLIIRVASAVFAVVAAIAMVVGFINDLQPYCEQGGLLHFICDAPPVPPPDGFNVVVAEFVVQNPDGSILSPTSESRQLSEWLYTTLKNDNSLLSSVIAVHLLGPDEVGPLPGSDRGSYDAHAPEIAQQYNATILIYGIVTAQDSGQAVELAFYVRDQGFGYGSELTGPDRLGRQLPFTLPLDPATLATTNAQLKARTTALQRIVVGLAQFSIQEYGKARAEFDDAGSTPNWRDEDGKEVAYLLSGAAQLRTDSPQTAPAKRLIDLDTADAAFLRARDLRPDYARVYLGLGAVALARADAHSRLTTPEDKARVAVLLDEARRAFTDALSAKEQPATAFVPAKAAYGLGQVHLKGVEQGISGWSLDVASEQFRSVIDAYTKSGTSNLIWFSGNAHAYLAWIAWQESNWQDMADESRAAIELLRQIPVNPPRAYIALYWTYNAVAEKNLGHIEAARAAYDRAIETGAGVVEQRDIDQWIEKRDRLSQGD